MVHLNGNSPSVRPALRRLAGVALSLALGAAPVFAAPTAELQTRQRLLENQINVHRLRREITGMREELNLLLRRQQQDDSDRGLQPEKSRTCRIPSPPARLSSTMSTTPSPGNACC